MQWRTGDAMGRVTVMAIPGLDLWFNSSDHLPPHFHARKPGEWEIRVYIMDCSEGHLEFDMKWPPRGGGPRSREKNRILEATLRNRVDLVREWASKVLIAENR